MEKIVWCNKYETGIDIIDFQHRILVERINDLIEFLNKNQEQNEVLPLILFLEDYTYYHFSTEEQFFDSFDYKEKNKHNEEHNNFKKKIEELKDMYKKSQAKIDENLLEFLMRWLMTHIMGTDMDFTNQLKKNMNF